MTFDQFTSYIKKDISAEKMRVYRALMKLGCDTDDIGMFEYMKVDYNTLKNVKYVMQMNAYFNLGRNARAINSSLTGNDLAENIAYRLQEKRDFDNETKA